MSPAAQTAALLQAPGATADEWFAFTTLHDLGSDLVPVVADRSLPVKAGSKLKPDQVGKVPSVIDRECVVGLPAWSTRQTTQFEIDTWASDSRMGFGFITRAVRACDVDLEDPSLVRRVLAIARTVLGIDLPVRSRAGSARVLLVARVLGTWRKVAVPVAQRQAVEFLGDVQMFVACGQHKEGARYVWSGLDHGIPTVSAERWAAFQRAVAAEFKAELSDGLAIEDAAVRDAKPIVLTDEQVADTRAALAYLAQASPAPGYDEWAKNGQGCKAMGDVGRDLFIDYSELLDNGDTDEAAAKWPALGGDRSGHAAIIKRAMAAGWANPRKAPAPSAEGFTNVEGAVEDALPPKGTAPVSDAEGSEALSDVELSRRLAALLHEHGFVHEHGGRRWMVYRSGVYRAGNSGEAVEVAKGLGVAIMRTAPTESNAFKREMALAQRSMSAAGINAALQLAQSDPRLAVRPEDFDADPDLLNVANGVVHLPTGALLPHDRSQLCGRQCSVIYEPHATAPTFDRFMADISSATGEEDADWVDYLQRAIGYSLSGRVNEETMFFLLGIGANGKSVFCNVIRRAMGNYATSVPSGFLMQSKRDGEAATPSLASLPGARLALANEVEAGSRISAQMVKIATSTDTIAARHLYGRTFEFPPTHTLWVRGNHKPIIVDNDEGIWRRIALVPFDRHFSADQKDTRLEERIMAEAPGVLAWMVRGYAAYLRDGLRPARRVAAASLAYRRESDLVGQWIEERAETGEGFEWPQIEAYSDYRQWCETQGLRPMTKKALTLAMTERGHKAAQQTTGIRHRVYRGLQAANFCSFDPMQAAQDERH